jgi:hypothetical protein
MARRDWVEWQAFDTSHDGFMSVGAHRLAGEPAALTLGQRLFTFPPVTPEDMGWVSHQLAGHVCGRRSSRSSP